jgi:hypothetical protein
MSRIDNHARLTITNILSTDKKMVWNLARYCIQSAISVPCLTNPNKNWNPQTWWSHRKRQLGNRVTSDVIKRQSLILITLLSEIKICQCWSVLTRSRIRRPLFTLVGRDVLTRSHSGRQLSNFVRRDVVTVNLHHWEIRFDQCWPKQFDQCWLKRIAKARKRKIASEKVKDSKRESEH